MRAFQFFKRVLALVLLLVLIAVALVQYGFLRLPMTSSLSTVIRKTGSNSGLHRHVVQEGRIPPIRVDIHRENSTSNFTAVTGSAFVNPDPKLIALTTQAKLTKPIPLIEGLKPDVSKIEPTRKKPLPGGDCKELLDEVSPGHVTDEGSSFTDKELDIEQYRGRKPLIPHILHQTWDNYRIPQSMLPYVQSIRKHNPDWDYWFWTQEDVKCYLQQKHPAYYQLYNSYYAMIFKTDVMRYFLLYDYGGIYLDIDVECLKPLDIWTHLAPAVLSHETYEHSFVMHRLKKPNVMTTILASRPEHPYYKLMQENLAKYHKAKPTDVLHSTGPYYLDDIYNLYVSTRNKTGNVQDKDDILVIHPKYWLPTHDNMNLSFICSCPLLRDGAFLKKTKGEKILRTNDTLQLCKQARDKHFQNKPDPQSYLDHHWIHTNLKQGSFKTANLVDIRTVFPDIVPVYKKLGLECNLKSVKRP